MNGETAPLYYVSPGQINFQVPWDAALGTGSIVVTVNAAASNTVSVPIVSAGPGLYPVVQNYPSYSTNSATNPVAAGGTIIAYATGSGPVSARRRVECPCRFLRNGDRDLDLHGDHRHVERDPDLLRIGAHSSAWCK